jgi:hypothetical protein
MTSEELASALDKAGISAAKQATSDAPWYKTARQDVAHAANCFAVASALRALPVTDEREAAPVEGDEAWEADLRGEVMLIVNEAIRDGSVGASHIADQVLAAVKAIVAKAPDAGLVEFETCDVRLLGDEFSIERAKAWLAHYRQQER